MGIVIKNVDKTDFCQQKKIKLLLFYTGNCVINLCFIHFIINQK